MTSACGQARYAAAPDPEFTRGLPPETTLPTSTAVPVSAEEPDLDAVEPDSAAIDIDQMFVVDDAGTAVANGAAWDVFDERVGARLGGNWSASVAVMIDGAVVHQVAFGERVEGTAEAVEPTDRFRIASISKTITAITTLRLVEQGALTLDDPVGQLLIDHLGVQNADPDAAAITVRGLLSHTAGLGKGQDLMFGNGAPSYADAARQALTSVGGSGYNYSNLGFVLLDGAHRGDHRQGLRACGARGAARAARSRRHADDLDLRDRTRRGVAPSPPRALLHGGARRSWGVERHADRSGDDHQLDRPETPGWKALSPEMMTAMRYRVPTGAEPSGYGLGLINYGGGTFGHTGTIENTHAMVFVQPDGVTWAVTVAGNTPSESEALRGIVQSSLAAAFPG